MPQPDIPIPEIIERLRRLMLTELDVRLAAGEIEETTFFFEGGLGLDSFAVVELIGLVEREFAFEFAEADLRPESFRDLRSLGSVVAGNLQRPG